MTHSCLRIVVVLGFVLGPAAVLAEDGAADLLELYGKATEFDPIFQTALYRFELGQEGVRESRSGVRPRLGGTLDTSWVEQNIRESDNFLFQVGKTQFFNSAVGIALTQPVYRQDALARIPQAKAEAQQAAAELRAEEQDLAYRLAEAFFGFMAARDNLEFAIAERTAIQQQLLESEERLASGLGAITDVHEARARYAFAQATEIAAKDELEAARLVIAEIIGEVPDDVKILSDSFPLVGPERPRVEEWVEAARFQNPRIKALEAASDVAAREVRVQRGEGRHPGLDFVAAYNYSDSGGSEFAGGGGSVIGTGTLALRLVVPIYDGGRSTAALRSAALQHKISLQTLERAKRVVEAETRKAFQGVVSGITRVEALIQTVFSQEAALADKETRMGAGLARGLEVLDARRDLFFARRDLAQARYDYLLASLNLKRWAGILDGTDLRAINAYLH